MIRSAITISLVTEARGGPFAYWDGLEDGCTRAAAAGFDAVEIFPARPVNWTQPRSVRSWSGTAYP